MPYTEDPFGRVVACHFGDEGDGDGAEWPDPCGMFTVPYAGLYTGVTRWWMGVYQPYMIGLANEVPPENPPHNLIIPVGDHDPSSSATDEFDLYYWGTGKRNYFVRLETTEFVQPGDYPFAIPNPIGEPWYHTIGFDIYYGILPQDITMDTPPDQEVRGARGDYSVEWTLDEGLIRTKGIPIISFWGGFTDYTPTFEEIRASPDPYELTGFGRHNTKPPQNTPRGDPTTRITIQSFCDNQTAGAPPPQPGTARPPANGWNPTVFYPPSPPDPGQPMEPPGSSRRAVPSGLARSATRPVRSPWADRLMIKSRLVKP